MVKKQNFSSVELILHVIGDGTEENVYRKINNKGEQEYFNSYSHIGLNKQEHFWAGREEKYDSWEEFWKDFTDLEEWWYYYQPIKLHNDFKDFVLKELLNHKKEIETEKDKGNYEKWRSICIR